MVICVSEWRKKGNFYNQQDVRAYNLKNEATNIDSDRKWNENRGI